MAAKDHVIELVDQLSDADLTAAERFIAELAGKSAVPVYEEAESWTVTGHIGAIDFLKKEFSFLPANTKRSLRCPYPQSAENLLLEHRHELIQVTGLYRLDTDYLPLEIVKVDAVREVDLSPITVTGASYGKCRLRLLQPLTLKPYLNETSQLICAEDPEWDIDVFAYTRDELLTELDEQLVALWQMFALEDDERLSEPACQLKRFLLANVEEVKRATE